MNKKFKWLLWALGLICVNVFAVPFAMWSTFAGSEEMKYLWILIGCLVLLLLNMGVIQTLVALKKDRVLFFWLGLLIVIIQTIGLYYMNVRTSGGGGDLFIIFGPIITSIAFLLMQNYGKKKD